MTDPEYVIDLSTGQLIDPPSEYSSNIVIPGERIGPDHLEFLKSQGESPEVLRALAGVGSTPVSYQSGPDKEIIPVHDPRFPWKGLFPEEVTGDERVRTIEQIRGRSQPGKPPNLLTGDWWPYCENGKPAGYKYGPPYVSGYNGKYYLRGTAGNIYKWKCGTWRTNYLGYKLWNCCGYHWYDTDLFLTKKINLDKLPKYTC